MDSENSTDSYSSLLENLRTIENMYKLFQNPSLTLHEDSRLGLKRVIDDFAQQSVWSQVKTFEEKYFKFPPKTCPNCGKMKKAGRQVVIAIDAVRRFAHLGNHLQQPSPTQLFSNSDSIKNGHSGIQQKNVAIVPKFQSGQETVNALERQSKWEDIRYAQEQKSSQKKNQTQHRISTPPSKLSRKVGYGGSKEVGPCRQRYNNVPSDVILAPTLMRFDRINGSMSTFSDSASSSASGSSSGNEREPHPRRRMLDHRRLYRSLSRSRSPSEDYSYSSSRSTSRSRSPDEVYSHRRSRDSNVYPSHHSTDKMGWFRRIKNKFGGMFHHQNDHHHHPGRHNTGVSSSKEDENVHAHHRSAGNPVSNDILHHKTKDQMVRKNKRRTQLKNRPDFKQQGHLRMLFGGFISHLWGSNKSKPSKAGKRRLERTVTGKRKLVVKKLHWWQKIRSRGSFNRGKSRVELGFKAKHPKPKGYKHASEMMKLL
ncbi:hypothetical protein C5167_023233 [Papaver somniferum]|uniref:Uncharacterized protein n=1 Tax=Papaver somniferum TaxID=3469 RepID=A0A4Y7JN77_PAPSO|nr:protein KOKOPELLI-like [Papaver somniferum]RZC61472.1 hypothetical protein C5167_023233 [Papaver somniferum]